MEQPDPSFADEFNVPWEDVGLVFDVRRAAVSLPLQTHRLKVLVEAGLIAFSSARFEFPNEVLNDAQHGSPAHLPKVFIAILKVFRRLVLWGSAHRFLLATHLCCHATSITASAPGPAHQLCATRWRLERGTNSATMESMTSAMLVGMSLTQVPSGIGGSASTIAFAT